MSDYIESVNNIMYDKEFTYAVDIQDVLEIKQYIKSTSNVGYACAITGKTALHILAKYSSFGGTNVDESNEIIRWLIQDKQINVNTLDAGNWTPLHLACRFASKTSHISTVKLLLELEADVNAVISKGTHSIILAITESRRDSSDNVVNLLLDYGANINSVYKGMVPLMFACRDSHIKCADDDYGHCRSSITTVELLLKRGANPNTIINGRTPLTLTYSFLSKGTTHIDTLKMLIKYGANQHLNINGILFYQMISDDLKEQLIPDLIESEDIIEKNDLMNMECVFCLDSLPEVKFNCGHICVCTNCYKFVNECYTCFEQVKTFSKIKITF